MRPEMRAIFRNYICSSQINEAMQEGSKGMNRQSNDTDDALVLVYKILFIFLFYWFIRYCISSYSIFLVQLLFLFRNKDLSGFLVLSRRHFILLLSNTFLSLALCLLNLK